VKFILVDQLLSLESGRKIVMAKNVSMAEECLGDHFPGFPVLPGVMMLEAAVQAAAWLVREKSGFAHSLVLLKQVRGVRYGNFVSPGNKLIISAEATEIGPTGSSFKIKGTVDDATAIQAKLDLAHLNLATTDPTMAPVDAQVITAQKERWRMLVERSGVMLPA